MPHYLSNKFKELEELADKYNWKMEKPENEEGPVEFKNEDDGSKIIIVNSPVTSTYSIQYGPDTDKDRIDRANNKGEVVEWVELFMKNY